MPRSEDLDPISQQFAAMLATLEPDSRIDTSPTGYRRLKMLKVNQNPRLIKYMLEPCRAWLESGQARLVVSRFTPAVVQITLTDIEEIAWSARQEDKTMIQEVYIAPEGAAALAKVCGALLGLGFTADPVAAESLMKSKATQIAAVLSFAGVRAVADVNAAGRATLTLNATTRGQLAPVLAMLNDQPVPGTSRPIMAMLKSSSRAQQEAAQQRQQEQQRAQLLAEAPAREAAQRAAARQEAAWRCRAVDLTSIEARLVACGARALPGADGLPVLQLGDTTISLRVEPAGTFGQIRLVGFTPSDYSTARRIITSDARETLMPFEPGKVEAAPQRAQKSLRGRVDDVLPLAASLATDQQLASALRKLPPRRKAALKKALDRR